MLPAVLRRARHRAPRPSIEEAPIDQRTEHASGLEHGGQLVEQGSPGGRPADRRVAEHLFLLGRQGVDARRDHQPDAVGDLLDGARVQQLPPGGRAAYGAPLDEHPHHLLEEERVPVGPHEWTADGVRRGGLAEELLGEGAHRRELEPRQLGGGYELDRLSREPEHEDGRIPGRAGRIGDERLDGAVRPLQVVDDDDHGPGACSVLEHESRGPHDVAIAPSGVGGVPRAEEGPQLGRHAGSVRAADAARNPVQRCARPGSPGGDPDRAADHLGQGPQPPLVAERRAPPDEEPIRSERAPELLGQSRLADPRLAGYDERAGAPLLLGQRELAPEARQDVGSVDEPPRWRRRDHRWRDPERLIGGKWLGLPFDTTAPLRGVADPRRGPFLGRLVDEDLARLGQIAQA